MCTISKVRKTQTYKNLNLFKKQRLLGKTNLIHLDHALKVVRFMGYENWEKITQFSEINKSIIKEIVFTQSPKNNKKSLCQIS